MSPITLLLVFVITLWSVLYYRRWELRKYASTIPIHKGYPIIGHVEYLFIRDIQGYVSLFRKLAEKCTEGIIGVWVATKLIVMITDPKYITILAKSRAKKGLLYQMAFGSYAEGVFITDDHTKWKELRMPLMQQSSKKVVDTEFHDIFIKQAKRFTQFIKDNMCGKKVKILSHLQDLSLDVFSETHLGVRTRELEERKISIAECATRHLEHNVEGGFLKIILTRLNQYKIKKFLAAPRNFAKEVLDEREKYATEHKGAAGGDRYYTDFLIRRMKERNLTKETVMKELADVLFAGVDTTPVVIGNALAYLAAYPEIQEKVYLEQVAILGENPDRSPTLEELSKMVLLDRVMKETLRLSSAIIIFRDVEENVKLDDKFTIPYGTSCIINFESITSDGRLWERPKEFYPDHFLPEKEAVRPPHSFPVFGFGPRICPGILFVKRFSAISLSFYIRNFRVSTQMKHEDFKFLEVLMREVVNAELEFEVRHAR